MEKLELSKVRLFRHTCLSLRSTYYPLIVRNSITERFGFLNLTAIGSCFIFQSEPQLRETAVFLIESWLEAAFRGDVTAAGLEDTQLKAEAGRLRIGILDRQPNFLDFRAIGEIAEVVEIWEGNGQNFRTLGDVFPDFCGVWWHLLLGALKATVYYMGLVLGPSSYQHTITDFRLVLEGNWNDVSSG